MSYLFENSSGMKHLHRTFKPYKKLNDLCRIMNILKYRVKFF